MFGRAVQRVELEYRDREGTAYVGSVNVVTVAEGPRPLIEPGGEITVLYNERNPKNFNVVTVEAGITPEQLDSKPQR